MKRGKFESPNRRKYASKVLVLVLAVLLIVGASVGGTLAWLQAKTENVTNTFTSAELFDTPETDFTVWEHQATENADGTYTLGSEKVKANTYDILPGVNIPKDPTVDIVDLEENAYLYLKVTGTLPTGMEYAIDDASWAVLDADEGLYYYKSMITASDDATTDLQVNILKGKQITVASTYSGTADNITLSFEAYMVQATGNGANATEAWANTYGK